MIDDNEASRLEARAALSAAGLELVGESEVGGRAAMLAASSCSPDAVLVRLDATAPEFDSVASALAHLPGTPVVVYSTAADEADSPPPDGTASVGVPFEAAQLRRAIDAALDAARTEARPASPHGSDPEAAATVIAVYSSKGGSGKTTLALNLAVGLRLASQEPVALIAAPNDQGDLPHMMEVEARHTLSTLIAALDADPAADVRPFMSGHSSGVALLPAAPGAVEGSTVSPEAFVRAIDAVSRQFCFVVLDLGVTLDPTTLAALRRASTVLHLVTPSGVSLHRAAHADRVMAAQGVDAAQTRVVVNYVTPDRVPADRIEDALGVPVFWTIPHDANLHRNAEMGRAIDQSPRKGGAAGAITRLARQMAGVPVETKRIITTLNMLA
ncbi:MAG: AAA family ATPase [Dehalococcoidia bacterium]|nr:AAA family ATPase [Dehalococcoidia bacterium]